MKLEKINSDSFENYIRSKGLKITPERLAILAAIVTFNGHFNADELYAAVLTNGEKISRATVYRSLPLFTESRIIHETIRCGEKSSYESAIGIAHHDHLLCLKCGKVLEFMNHEIERLQDELCKKYQFESVDHSMSIRGYCKSCQKTND